MKDEPDHITGVAVLREVEEGKEFLTVLFRSDATRTIGTLTIPVAEKGKSHNHCEGKPWTYVRIGDMQLEVRPSVHHYTTEPIPGSPENRMKTIFHNGGIWTVKYVCADNMNSLCRSINESYWKEVENHWRLYPKSSQ